MRLRARPAMRRLRRTVTVAGAALLAAFGLAVAGGAAAVPATAATSSCAAAYSVPTDWGSGFTANLTITDNGTAAITGWTVTYTYAGNQTLANGWNGNWTQSGKTVTVTNESYNGSLAAGAGPSPLRACRGGRVKSGRFDATPHDGPRSTFEITVVLAGAVRTLPAPVLGGCHQLSGGDTQAAFLWVK